MTVAPPRAPWYVEFFGGDYQRLYAHEQERSAREAAGAARALGLLPGDRVLDLCCGTGRHLRELRAAGFKALGFDLHHGSLRAARAPCVRAEMRALPLRTGSLDAVVSLFSSFGYLESDDEDLRVLQEISRALRPGGQVLLDLLSREHALSGFVDSQQRLDADGSLIVEQRSFDALRGRLTTAFVLITPAGVRTDSIGHSLRLYTLTELNRLLERAGLALTATLGSFAGEPFSLDSVRMIALARAT